MTAPTSFARVGARRALAASMSARRVASRSVTSRQPPQRAAQAPGEGQVVTKQQAADRPQAGRLRQPVPRQGRRRARPRAMPELPGGQRHAHGDQNGQTRHQPCVRGVVQLPLARLQTCQPQAGRSQHEAGQQTARGIPAGPVDPQRGQRRAHQEQDRRQRQAQRIEGHPARARAAARAPCAIALPQPDRPQQEHQREQRQQQDRQQQQRHGGRRRLRVGASARTRPRATRRPRARDGSGTGHWRR